MTVLHLATSRERPDRVDAVARAIYGAWARSKGVGWTWEALVMAGSIGPDEFPTSHGMLELARQEAIAAIAAADASAPRRSFRQWAYDTFWKLER